LVSLQLHNGAELGQAGVVLGLDVGIQETAGNIFELFVADRFRLNVFFAHGGVLGFDCVLVGRLQLHNGAQLGQAGVVLGLDVGIQETASNIFELLVANGFRFYVFFAHGGVFRVWLVGGWCSMKVITAQQN
jgi:hypothetical protein